MVDSPKVSIVILNWNGLKDTIECLESLKKISYPNYKVIVVDNASSDGSLQLIRDNSSWVKLVANQANIGYTKAVNQGLRFVEAEFYLILNPDIVVLPGAIEIMMHHVQKQPQVGILSCKLLNEDGTLQYSVRRFLDLRTYLYRFTPLRGLMAGSAIERYYLMQEWDHRDNRLVDWVLGGCMLARKEAIDEVGLMDEKFFLYFDDVDWCYRMWEKDWQVAYVGEAAMIHKHMRTSANRLFNRATYEHFKSLFYFLWKHGLKLPANSPSVQE